MIRQRSTAQQTRISVLLAILCCHAVPATARAQTRADSISRRRVQPLPAIASAPETGLQYGATVLAVWEPAAILETRPSSLTASALRTAKQQTRVKLDAEHWSRGNERRVAGSLQWQKFPLPYFGIGSTSAVAEKDRFTPRGFEATVSVQQRVRASWYATGSVRHVDQQITFDSGGTTDPQLLIGGTGGTITELSVGAVTDTRDNLFAPRRGRWVQLSYARSASGVWSDFSFGTLRIDARGYRSIAREHVLAAQLQVTSVDGAPPFDQMALIGSSDIMRGYARGRYRDRSTIALQGEYRTPIRHHLGVVLFGGAGTLAPRLESLFSHGWIPSYGSGLRFELDRRQHTAIRADYGRGRDGASGVYIGFNTAF